MPRYGQTKSERMARARKKARTLIPAVHLVIINNLDYYQLAQATILPSFLCVLLSVCVCWQIQSKSVLFRRKTFYNIPISILQCSAKKLSGMARHLTVCHAAKKLASTVCCVRRGKRHFCTLFLWKHYANWLK